MRLFLLLTLLLSLSACRQIQQAGAGLSQSTGYVTRPVVSGSKKLAHATASGSRKVVHATASGTRAMASATAAGSRKVVTATATGAKSLASGATRLITFGNSSRQPPPAPLAPAKATQPKESSLPPAHIFPTSGLLVTDAELGPDATRLQATAVNLAGGWILNGTSLAYRLAPGADDPTALRVKGKPATAVLQSEGTTTTGTADEIHYHAANQILTLKGNPTLGDGTSRVSATASYTQIRLHLPTGAISINGPASWGQ